MTRPHEILLTVALLAGLCGCQPGAGFQLFETPRPQPTPPTLAEARPPSLTAISPAQESLDAAAAPARQLSLRLEVIRIEAPAGTLSGHQTLWGLLDETTGSATTTLTLRENGFRVALGSSARRDAIKANLEAIPDMRAAHNKGMPPCDRPMDIALTAADQDLAVFFIDPAGTMGGLSFDDARPFFKVQFGLDPADPRSVRVRIAPEVREPPGPLQYTRTPNGLRPAPLYRGRIFDDLAIDVVIPADSFLVIGPTAEIHRTPMLARPFLTVSDADPPRENLFVFIPEVSETSAWWSPAGVAAATGP